MKQLIGLTAFAAAFLVAGVLMHYALYDRPGVFVWSWSEDPETAEAGIRRSVLKAAEPTSPGQRGSVDNAASLTVPGDTTANVSSSERDEETDEETGEAPGQAKASPDSPSDNDNAAGVESDNAAGAENLETSGGDSGEISLFNGEDLGKWEKTLFGGEGDVFVNEEGHLEFGFGAVMTGVHWSEEPPRTSNFEIRLEAMKLDGYDFFCALTFPVKKSHATYVLGGWGGGVVGISSVDDLNASENETMTIEGFEPGEWFRIRVRVTDEKLEAWLDDRKTVDLALEGREISLLPGDIELSVPIGIASYQTRAQYRDIVWVNLQTSGE